MTNTITEFNQFMSIEFKQLEKDYESMYNKRNIETDKVFQLKKEIEVNNKKWYAIVENLDNLVDEQQFKIEALQARIREGRSDK